MDVKKIMASLEAKHPGEKEYLQAVHEVLESVESVYNAHPEFVKAKIVERIVEPDRIFTFRVDWVDDKGEVQSNLGYRVQFNSAIGPYKGGIRFHKAVNLSMLKFLGFEQTFKNALTTLPMGGAKGGSDFDPIGKSNGEIMRFCQAFMLELWKHIGPDTDVPAGDVGVGGREIGYMYGMYKKLAREYNTGVLTGKGINWGGPDGCVEVPNGMTHEMIDYMLELRASNQNIVEPFAKKFAKESKFTAGKKVWVIPTDIALPSAFQNELNEEDAKTLIANGVELVAEVSNMGCTPEAIKTFQDAKLPFAPGKAVNAGGVATSGLEMTQNAAHLSWTKEEVDAKLHQIMESIHNACLKYGQEDGYINYVKGANIAGFMKVASAMLDQGVI